MFACAGGKKREIYHANDVNSKWERRRSRRPEKRKRQCAHREYKTRVRASIVSGTVSSVAESTQFSLFVVIRKSDLLKKMLVYDHRERIDAKKALEHVYFDPIRGMFN